MCEQTPFRSGLFHWLLVKVCVRCGLLCICCSLPCYCWLSFYVSECKKSTTPLAFHWVQTLVVTTLLCAQILRVFVPLFYVCCEAPFARVISCGCHLLKTQFLHCWNKGLHTVQFFRSKGLLGKGFSVRGFGPFWFVFSPCGLIVGWQESSFILWYRDPL